MNELLAKLKDPEYSGINLQDFHSIIMKMEQYYGKPFGIEFDYDKRQACLTLTWDILPKLTDEIIESGADLSPYFNNPKKV